MHMCRLPALLLAVPKEHTHRYNGVQAPMPLYLGTCPCLCHSSGMSPCSAFPVTVCAPPALDLETCPASVVATQRDMHSVSVDVTLPQVCMKIHITL